MILAIDLGSTSFKAAVVDERLRIRGFFGREIHHRFLAGGRVELDVAEANAALRKAIREAIQSAGVRAAGLQAVAITSQAQTFTILDEKGHARLPFISWQDRRAARTCERLKRQSAMRDFGRHSSFGSLVPPLQLCQLRHLRETQPALLAADNVVVCLPTYLVHRWCGTGVIDENLAAMSGMYSLALRAWWPAALRLCGLLNSQLPDVCPIGAVAGRTDVGAASFGLPKDLPVILAGNDQTAGAYATQLDENHGLLVTLGTAQAAYICTDRMPPPHANLFRGPFPERGYYRMAADSCGGSVINWAKTVIAGCETDEQFFAHAAQSPPGCRGLEFDPDGGHGLGGWKNIGLHHTSADFARSVLECLTRRMSALVRQLGVRLELYTTSEVTPREG
ncbi:MAG: hypothetical protein KIS67_19550, partial [Verrucomicrobiae bacterium]|nr:hypothetical protein [Verrucomicrobiae bacterium]